ncbi:ribosomal protein L13 [Tepidiforma thermophila]|uniref:Large ribosomal subunit protein uL13 n=1 Tax=Tepidiforma thermophila (strain KCTC 52669 / CGMCC 1.13589 / G233) TaxID=2761530 RepID=A0A2A9HH41_TEPT2|nr:ribosomal protein L13 [Tepidiforma thermophila]
MNTTVRIKASQIYKDWHVIDAAGQPLGRVATRVATLLRGKHKPTYEPHLDDGDFVIVVNAAKVRVSGKKAQDMVYYRHSGYPGGLKARSFAEQLQRFPEKVIERAVWGMLPKGPLGKQMLRHLKVYAGPDHPHQAQVIASQRAQEARKAALEVLATTPYRPKGLRPLTAAEVVVPAAPSSEAAKVAARARARVMKQEAEAAAPVETAPAEEPAPPPAEAPASGAETPAAAAETETTAAAAPAAEAKPARRRRAKAEETEE